MSALLGAIKSGQDRLSRDSSKDQSLFKTTRDESATTQTQSQSPRPATPSGTIVRGGQGSSPSTSSVIITSTPRATAASDLSTPKSSRHQPQASTNSIAGSRTPTSADGHARPVTPSSTSIPAHLSDSAAAASSPPPNGTPTQPLAIRKTQRSSRGTPIALRDSESTRSQAALGSSVQSNSPSVNASSIDPLSQHIFLRTNTDASKTSKARLSPAPDSPIPDASSPIFSSPIADVGKEKKKSFLGRLSMRASKKKDDASDHASESGEPRLEGSNAHVFSSIVDSAGYIPHHKEPPRYIKVKQHNKKVKDFDRMFLAQELIGTRPQETPSDNRIPIVTVTTSNQGRKKTATGGAIWATEFSKDGMFFAAGGRDHVVRIWQVISTPEDRRAQEEEESENGGGEGERLSAPVFLEKPVREFVGHTGEILDISWSKNNFLLSTSMDKTVRLWHISREECLCTFKHKELVSKVAFHPTDDRFFLAGCLDATLRLWSIPDKSIAYSAQMSDMITAVAFSPDGKMAIAGLLNGYCYLLETEGLKLLTNIHVRSSRGRNAKGSKITGIVSMELPDTRPPESVILVTSTDARVRIYSLKDKKVDCKFKGHEHSSGQLSASFSDDGKYVICGSESRKVFIWSVSSSDSITKDRYPCESFDAHRDMVTTAVFAPTKTRQLLGASGDPIYDLCNPPPITLMSLEETMASQSGQSNNTLHNHEDPANSSPPQTTQPTLQPTRAKPEESPAYIARSTHYDGNIVVTTDDSGVVKVFRQDCAAVKRRHESWETGSLSRKLGATSGLVGRSGSIITRTSASSAAHSRRGSLSYPSSHLVGAPGTPQMGADRINSWRYGIEGGSSRPNSLVGSGIAQSRTERSISPSKSRTPLSALASDARRFPYAATTSSPLSPHFAVGQGRAHPPGSPSTATSAARLTYKPISASASVPTISTSNHDNPSIAGDRTSTADSQATHTAHATHDVHNDTHTDSHTDTHSIVAGGPGAPQEEAEPRRSIEPSMAFKSDDDTLRLDPVGASYGFWNLNRWKNLSLRPSFITGVVSGALGGSEPLSPVESNGSQNDEDKSVNGDKGDKGEASNGTGSTPKSHRSRLSFGVNNILPKSPLGKASDGNDEANKHSRSKSSATLGGRSGQHLTPTITVNDENGPVDPSRLQLTSGTHSPYTRNGSIISYLSSEMASTDGEAEAEGGVSEGDEMRCTKCGAHEFKGRRVNGLQKMQCSRCGKLVD